MKPLARRLGLGKVALYGWHRPIGLVRQSITEGGPLEQIRTEQGRRQMVEAATRLPRLSPLTDAFSAQVLYLSGQKYWYQTLFCFVSLQLCLPFRVTPMVFDDGTLDAEIRQLVLRVVPWVQFVGIDEIETRLEAHMPADRFPALRRRRLEYPHLRKFTDLHSGMTGFGLVLDSDMLFHGNPQELADWFREPKAMFMQDVADAYGYSPSLMCDLAGRPMLSNVNVGLYALDRRRIDWEWIERCCARQLEAEGPNYLQEQGLTALELTHQDARPLSAHRYIVMPDHVEGISPTAVLHHYVAHSKRSYFQHGWRLVQAKLNNST